MRALRIAAIAGLLTACAEPAPALEGVVVDALDGAPIEGARVSARGVATTTDAAGRFALPVAGGPLHASAPDHLGTTRRRVEAAPITLPLWPRHPDDAAIDAHFARLAARRALRDDPDDPALRPAARAYLRGEPRPALEGDIGAVRAELDAPPAVIRIWRRSIDGAADSCAGRIDEIPFEDYVAGVLPHEWIPSWHDESLRAGSLAIRTYAWGWVARGGKYDCADLDDTARSQVYDDDRNERASAAVFATTAMAITVDGVLASGEYSAENGNPTATGVDDPLCEGRELFGHGRGMCQWGSQRWALDGRDHLWIATHYYPGSAIEGGAPAADDYDARAVLPIGAPIELVSGTRAEVTVRFENTGRREWTAEGTRLVAADAEPSPFFDDVSWIDAATLTAPDAYRYAPGAIGEYTFQITAPEVTEAREVTDELVLAHAGVGPFGERVTLRVRVLPREGSVPPPSGLDAGAMGPPVEPPPMDGPSGGCAVSPSRGGSLAILAHVALLLIARLSNSKKRGCSL